MLYNLWNLPRDCLIAILMEITITKIIKLFIKFSDNIIYDDLSIIRDVYTPIFNIVFAASNSNAKISPVIKFLWIIFKFEIDFVFADDSIDLKLYIDRKYIVWIIDTTINDTAIISINEVIVKIISSILMEDKKRQN